VDYNKPQCDHAKIKVLTHSELNNGDLRTDFAFAYSSFEHDGLGRYGDPIAPDGDLQAMRHARDRLKDGGILFCGVPLGRDCLLWNCHRIYGKKRLPLLLKGWHCLDVFCVYKEVTASFPFDAPLGTSFQVLLVLKKMEGDYPDDAVLKEYMNTPQDRKNGQSTRNNELLNRIAAIIMESTH